MEIKSKFENKQQVKVHGEIVLIISKRLVNNVWSYEVRNRRNRQQFFVSENEISIIGKSETTT